MTAGARSSVRCRQRRHRRAPHRALPTAVRAASPSRTLRLLSGRLHLNASQPESHDPSTHECCARVRAEARTPDTHRNGRETGGIRFSKRAMNPTGGWLGRGVGFGTCLPAERAGGLRWRPSIGRTPPPASCPAGRAAPERMRLAEARSPATATPLVVAGPGRRSGAEEWKER